MLEMSYKQQQLLVLLLVLFMGQLFMGLFFSHKQLLLKLLRSFQLQLQMAVRLQQLELVLLVSYKIGFQFNSNNQSSELCDDF